MARADPDLGVLLVSITRRRRVDGRGPGHVARDGAARWAARVRDLYAHLLQPDLSQAGATAFLARLGHAEPLLDEAGKPLYRPGSVLLAYYLLGFSFLLVHYLHDGFFFCRKRYLRDS